MTRATLQHFAILIAACLCAGCVCLLCALPAHAATVSSLPYTQVFTTADSAADDSFTYTLVAKDYTPQTPMPQGSVNNTYTFTVKGTTDGAVTIDAAGVPDGTYVYTLQDASTHQEGYVYESRVYTVSLMVSDQTVSTVIERNTDGKKVSVMELDPSYERIKPYIGSAVTVSKASETPQVSPGGRITYAITVTSTGDEDAVGIWVKDHLPNYTNYQSCDNGGVFIADNNRGAVNWFIDRLTPGQSIVVRVEVAVDMDVPADAQISNTALYQVTKDPAKPDFFKDPDVGQGGSTGVQGVSNAAVNVLQTSDNNAIKRMSSAATGDMPVVAIAIGVICLAGICFAGTGYVRNRRKL